MTETMKVTPGQFESAFGGILEEYLEDIRTAATEDVEAAAEVALKVVKEKSPVETRGYRNGWRVDMKNSGTDIQDAIIYNAKKPGLAHLLEKGHALRGGGRSNKHPHISTAAKLGMAELKRRLHE